MKTELSRLIGKFKSVYNGSPWYGDSLLQKLENVDAAKAFAVPAGGLHSVAQLVAHLLTWRRVLTERLKGKAFKPDINSDEDWPPNAALEAKGWGALLAELAANQAELLDLLSAQTDDLLAEPFDENYNFRFLIEGIIQHDVYHIGQIGLTCALLR